MPAAVDVSDALVLGLLQLAPSPRGRLPVSDVFLLDLRIYLVLAARAHPRHVVFELVVAVVFEFVVGVFESGLVAHDWNLCLGRHLVVAAHSYH